MQPFGRNRYGPQIGGLRPFGGDGGGSSSNTMSPGPRPTCVRKGTGSHLDQCGQDQGHLHVKCDLDPCSCLATIIMGRKFGGLRPLFGEAAGSPSNTVACAEAYLHNKWHLDSSSGLATIEMGRKFGGLRPLFGDRGAESPTNTKSPGPRPTSITSGILIQPAVWPQ